MAINLNFPKYGDQFKVFVDFAKANENNLDALACIDNGIQDDPNVIKEKESLVLDGKLRSIVAKTDDDKIKSWRKNLLFSRRQSQKDLNNAVRDLFKETVLKICGVKKIDDLPKAVRDVMKKGDYDNEGHPLSACRIKAVTQAIRLAAVEEEQDDEEKMPRIDQ